MKRLCLLAVVAAAAVVLCAGQTCPEDLGPNGVTFIPHPSNCSAYYRCTKSGSKLELCPSYHDMGQLCYNDQLKICDWSANVRCCNPFMPDTTTNTTEKPTETPPNGECTQRKPLPNCLKYTEDGNEVCCREPWVFNPIVCACDLQRNVPSCKPTDAERLECYKYRAGRLSSLARLVDLAYGDNQPDASNDDSFGAPSAE